MRDCQLAVVADQQLLFGYLHPQALHQLLVGIRLTVAVLFPPYLLPAPLSAGQISLPLFVKPGYGWIFGGVHGSVNLLILYAGHSVRDLVPLAAAGGIHPGWHSQHDHPPFGQFQQIGEQQGRKPACPGQPVFGVDPYHTAPKTGVKLYLFGYAVCKCLSRQIPEYLVDPHVQHPDIGTLLLLQSPVDPVHLQLRLTLQPVVYQKVGIEVRYHRRMLLTGGDSGPYASHQTGVVPQVGRGKHMVPYLMGKYLCGKLLKLQFPHLPETYHNRMVIQPYHCE